MQEEAEEVSQTTKQFTLRRRILYARIEQAALALLALQHGNGPAIIAALEAAIAQTKDMLDGAAAEDAVLRELARQLYRGSPAGRKPSWVERELDRTTAFDKSRPWNDVPTRTLHSEPTRRRGRKKDLPRTHVSLDVAWMGVAYE